MEHSIRKRNSSYFMGKGVQGGSVPQPHQLTPEQEQAMHDVCNLAEYQSLPPSQILPALADKGIYIAPESSLYRVLKKHRQLAHRGRSHVPEPTSFTATGPNQVYSRNVVAWEVHDTEPGEHSRALVERTLIREGCLHSDNGAPMTSYTLKSHLAELGMAMPYSRPRVRNDNPYSESLSRTVEYCPKWPPKGFKSLEAVYEQAKRNNSKRHSSQPRQAQRGRT